MQASPETAARQHWMGVLARAHVDEPSRERLQRHEAALRDTDYQMIRAPATAIWPDATSATLNWRLWPTRICRARSRLGGCPN